MGQAGPAWSRTQGLGEVAVRWAPAVEKHVFQNIFGRLHTLDAHCEKGETSGREGSKYNPQPHSLGSCSWARRLPPAAVMYREGRRRGGGVLLLTARYFTSHFSHLVSCHPIFPCH